MREKTKQMIYAALLTAIAIIIPIQFSFLSIQIPPFSATLLAHLPMFIAMVISPSAAITVGVGSAVGFMFAFPPVVPARALTHILVGYVGAKIINKKKNYLLASIITAPLHGLAEAIVVIPFIGFDLYTLAIVTGVGTILHHAFDATVTGVLLKSIAATKNKDIYSLFTEKKEMKIDNNIAA
ncbi:MAG: ECF transporter S component [Clostridium sp.]